MLIRLSPIDTEALIPCISSLHTSTDLPTPDFNELDRRPKAAPAIAK